MPTIDPELPWGCWLRLEARRGYAPVVFVDEETGLEWRSIREAFWVGRLRGRLLNGQPPAHRLEMMHAVLATRARRDVRGPEEAADVFGGSRAFAEWHADWLRMEGLVIDDADGRTVLSDEGSAVLRMLAATRPHPMNRNRPSAVTIRELSELGLGPERREARLARLEKETAVWDAAFLRRRIGARPAVVLSRRGAGPVPVMQVAWTLLFDDEEQRDRFYDWLCLRLDRWTAWSDLVGAHQASELTHRLLLVMSASLGEGRDDGGRSPGRELT